MYMKCTAHAAVGRSGGPGPAADVNIYTYVHICKNNKRKYIKRSKLI